MNQFWLYSSTQQQTLLAGNSHGIKSDLQCRRAFHSCQLPQCSTNFLQITAETVMCSMKGKWEKNAKGRIHNIKYTHCVTYLSKNHESQNTFCPKVSGGQLVLTQYQSHGVVVEDQEHTSTEPAQRGFSSVAHDCC